MRGAFSVSGLGLLSCSLLAALASGCVAKDCKTEEGNDAVCLETPERYESSELAQSIRRDYDPGTPVRIDGVYGNIEVVEGVPGEVVATFRPFAYGGQNEDEAALDAMRDKARMEHVLDQDTLLVRSSRTDGELPLVGMDLQIALPPEFDAELSILSRGDGTWNPGDVDVDFVALAPSVVVSGDDLSDCEISGGPALVYTKVRCGSDIRVLAVSDEVDIESTGLLGSVELIFSSISEASAGGSVRAGEDISVVFPAQTSFSATAQAEAPGVVAFGALPATCTSAENAETAKSLTCGEGGPVYTLEADGNVSVSVE